MCVSRDPTLCEENFPKEVMFQQNSILRVHEMNEAGRGCSHDEETGHIQGI